MLKRCCHAVLKFQQNIDLVMLRIKTSWLLNDTISTGLVRPKETKKNGKYPLLGWDKLKYFTKKTQYTCG